LAPSPATINVSSGTQRQQVILIFDLPGPLTARRANRPMRRGSEQARHAPPPVETMSALVDRCSRTDAQDAAVRIFNARPRISPDLTLRERFDLHLLSAVGAMMTSIPALIRGGTADLRTAGDLP